MFYYLLDLRSGECDVVSLYVLCCSVNGSVCFVKQFAICLDVCAILLLNVMDLLSVKVLYWIDHVWSSKECMCCACDTSERLDAPSICSFVVFFMSEVISSFMSERWITGVFPLMLFL